MIQRLITKFLGDVSRAAKTTAFRYSLLFTVAISILVGVSMVMIYQTAAQEIAEQIDSRLYAETARLHRAIEYRVNMGLESPVKAGNIERVPTEPNMSFCMTSSKVMQQHNIQHTSILNASFPDICRAVSDNGNAQQRSAILRVMISPVDTQYALVVGYNAHNEQLLLQNMLQMVYLMTTILLLASFFGSFVMSRAIVNSTARISRIARRIVDGDFSERIRTTKNDSDELNRLAHDLNHMLDRIEDLITSQRQVTNNIAHDLRSPLNRLRNRMEVALLDRQVSCDDLRDVIADSIDDAENLLRTFNALLNIAQVESRARDDFEEINLTTICEDLAELYEVLTEEGNHEFHSDIASGIYMMGNRHLLAQALTNLLDNAVKYTPKGGKISLQATTLNKDILVSIIDDGEGIPDDKRDDVLKRFVRLDSARSTQGNGLGLSLVAAVVNLHGGRIELNDNNPGLRVDLWLPQAEHFKKRLYQDAQPTNNPSANSHKN